MNFDLLEDSHNIAVAFSGGKDSTFLLWHTFYWCHRNNKKFFGAIIINHNLRENIQEEINSLLDYWRSKIHIEVISWDSPIKSQKHARDFRLNNLSFFAIKNQIDTILLGHNLEDNIHTFFLRKERNSTEWGLSSISQITIINTIKFIRPILSISESYIYEFLNKHQIFYVKDPSNESDIYRRNYIRHHLHFNYHDTLRLINTYAKERQNITEYVNEWIRKYFTSYNLFYGSFLLHNLPKESYIYTKILAHIINMITGKIVNDFSLLNNFFSSNTETLFGCIFDKNMLLSGVIVYVYKSYRSTSLIGEGIWQKTFLIINNKDEKNAIYVENNHDMLFSKSYINPNIPMLNKEKLLVQKKEHWNNIIIRHILPNYLCIYY